MANRKDRRHAGKKRKAEGPVPWAVMAKPPELPVAGAAGTGARPGMYAAGRPSAVKGPGDPLSKR